MSSPSALDVETLHDLIGERARVEPDRVALREGGSETTFAGLWTRTGAVASALRSQGLKQGDVVAVALPRSGDLVVACLAVLRAGGVALGLDLNAPAARNARIVAAAAAAWSITKGKPIPDCVASTGNLNLDAIASTAAGPRASLDPESKAFLVFTSGSTGEPKGVVLSHRSLSARVELERAVYLKGPADVSLFLTSPAFIALPVGLAYLATGATLLVVSDAALRDVSALSATIRDGAATHAGFSPRLLESLIALPEARRDLASLRVIGSIAEAIPQKIASQCREILPHCRLFDRYGATETCGIVTMADLGDEQGRYQGESAGTKLPGVALQTMDREGKPANEGEIWVSSRVLASGYLSGEDSHDPRFVKSVLPGETTERLWYRTGDRGRLTPDGRLTVLGRLDLQLNIDGVRLDPREVEEALRTHPSVQETAVWAHPDEGGRDRLIAYIVDREAPASAGVLRGFLTQLLPQALIPSRFVHLPALPLTTSGKVNRAALPKPETIGRSHVEPRNDREATLLAIFRDVLGAPEVGVSDDFFEWGGDSLKAFALMTRIGEATSIRLPAATILNAPTVAELAMEVAQGDPGQVVSVWLRKEGELKPLVCLPGLAGDPLWFFPLIAALDPRQPILGLSFVGLKPPITIEDTAARAVRALMVLKIPGPYSLLGHSLGGVLAVETARVLVNSGETVDFIGLIDTFVPGLPGVAPKTTASRLFHRWIRWRNRMIGITREHLRRPMEFLGISMRRFTPFFVPGLKEAGRRHRIAPLDVPVTLFRANERSVTYDLAKAWRPIARGGIEVIDIPGHHFNLITGGRARILSARVAEALDRSRRRGEGV